MAGDFTSETWIAGIAAVASTTWGIILRFVVGRYVKAADRLELRLESIESGLAGIESRLANIERRSHRIRRLD